MYQPVVALELRGNSLLQFRRAVDCRIFGLPRADRGNGGVLDEIRRIEVGLTRRKTNNVNACAFQLVDPAGHGKGGAGLDRSEEHTSELQSLMRTSYAVFCLKKKKLQIKMHI